MASGYARAAYSLSVSPTKVTIIGRRKDPATTNPRDEGLRCYASRKAVQVLDLDVDRDRIDVLGYADSNVPTGYAYVGQICPEPSTNHQELMSRLLKVRGTH